MARRHARLLAPHMGRRSAIFNERDKDGIACIDGCTLVQFSLLVVRCDTGAKALFSIDNTTPVFIRNERTVMAFEPWFCGQRKAIGVNHLSIVPAATLFSPRRVGSDRYAYRQRRTERDRSAIPSGKSFGGAGLVGLGRRFRGREQRPSAGSDRRSLPRLGISAARFCHRTSLTRERRRRRGRLRRGKRRALGHVGA